MRYTKNHRLLNASDFRHVFEKPRKIRGETVDFYIRSNDKAIPRLGLAVPKKAVRRSVDRNRIKRLLREGFRKHQPSLVGYDIVVVVRNLHTHTLTSEWQQVCDFCS